MNQYGLRIVCLNYFSLFIAVRQRVKTRTDTSHTARTTTAVESPHLQTITASHHIIVVASHPHIIVAVTMTRRGHETTAGKRMDTVLRDTGQ